MDAKIIEMPKQENENENLPSLEESKNILKNIISELGLTNENLEENPAIEDLASIFTIMDLPDEEFIMMSGIMLSTLEKGLNNSNDRLILAQALGSLNIKAEDLVNLYQEITEMIDEKFKEQYDEKRRNYLKAILSKFINSIAETEGIPKRTIHIPLQICNPDAKMPTYAKVGDAGMDVYALEDYEIKPGETKLIPTGLKVAIPNGYELQVRPKSGRALKTKLRVANTPGTIDSGYRDEIGVIIENIEAPIKAIDYEFDMDGKPIIKSIEHGSSYFIGKGEKFAQLVLSEVPTAAFDIVDDISIFGGDRNGGFGSTGLQ